MWSARRPYGRPLGFPLLGGLIVAGLALATIAFELLPSITTGSRTAEDVGTTVTTGGSARAGGRATSGVPVGAPNGAPITALVAVGPAGFATKPAWAVPVAQWTKSVAADGGTVLTRDRNGQVLLLDPGSGAVRRLSSTATGPTQDGPWLTRIDGRPAAALVGDGVLSYWPLPTPGADPGPGADPAEGTAVPLPGGTKVSWVGSAPLVTSAGGGAAVVRGGKYVPVSLPPRARPLATDGSTVLAVVGAQFVRQAVGAPVAGLRDLPRPRGAGRRPVRVEAVGTDLLFTVWPRTSGHGQLGALVRTSDGALAVQTDLEGGLDLAKARVVRETAGTQTLLGPVLVDTYTNNLNLLDPRYAVRGLTRGHAWALLDGRATDIRLNRTGDFRTEPFPAGDPALPIGVVAAAGARPETAVVVTRTGDGWVLAGLRADSVRAT